MNTFIDNSCFFCVFPLQFFPLYFLVLFLIWNVVRNSLHGGLVSCIFKVRLLGQYFTIGAPSSVNILKGVLAVELQKYIIELSQGLQITLLIFGVSSKSH